MKDEPKPVEKPKPIVLEVHDSYIGHTSAVEKKEAKNG